MAKRSKRHVPTQEELSKPSCWRLQHGGFGEPVRDTDPETGTPVQHRRAVDSIAAMLGNGTITPEMHEAGAMFRTQFRAAALDGMRTTQLLRIPAASGDTMTERQVSARQRVLSAMDILGGLHSPGGSAVWHVLGLECSIREWGSRQGWQGCPIAPAQAQGMFTAALAVLAMHYGLVPRPRMAARCAHAKDGKATHECIAPRNPRGVESRHVARLHLPECRGHGSFPAISYAGGRRARHR
jgi:hypothetical protein